MKLLANILCLLPLFVSGQLVTNTSLSPVGLVQNVLLGPGVVVSNISFSGSPQAIAQFTANGTNLGITQGIIITTGTVFNNGNGPQGPNDDPGSGIDNNTAGSALLESIMGSSGTYNASVLQFDFTAVGDSISFNYVFASEEYLEYVNSGFNDVFGLFISGPNIIGNQNIAKLPNQTIVTIDNVNNISNSAYYVGNGNGGQSPYNASPAFIQYDGFTKVLTAASKVQCGKTYHLTIAIADVGDGILDSGIFLEAQSLTSKKEFELDYSLSAVYFNDPTLMAEGCVSSDITLTREDASTQISIPVSATGSAIEGVDYEDIPNNIAFNVGQTTQTFSFDVFNDGIVENQENIYLIFLLPNECGVLIPDTIELKIESIEPVSVTLKDTTLVCGPGSIATLVPVVTGGLEPYGYMWSTFETTETITISPPVTTVYSLTVTDFCSNTNDTDNATVTVPQIPPLTIDPIADIINLCPFTPTTMTGQASGGSGGYAYLWKNNAGQTIINTASVNISPPVTTVVELQVTDICGLKESIFVNVIVTTPLLIPAINTPEIICPGDSALLSASASSGMPPYTFIWDHSGETTPDSWVTPFVTTEYTVNIADGCQTYSLPISTTVPVYDPYVSFTYNSINLEIGAPVQFDNLTVNGVSYTWDLGNGSTSTAENPITTYNDIGTYEVTLIAVDEIGCIDSITKLISIGHVLYIPNTFTPDGNRFNNNFFPVSFNIEILEFQVFDRWGELIFESKNDNNTSWDGTYQGKQCQDGTYVYKIHYVDPSREEHTFVGHVTLLR